VGSIKDSKGFMQSVSYGLDSRQGTQSIALDRLGAAGGLRMESVNDYPEVGVPDPGSITHMAMSWRADSGHILSDTDHTYEVTLLETSPPAHACTVRTNSGGLTESYAYDWRTGKSVERHTDGTVTSTWYIVKHGVNYGHYCRYLKEPAMNGDPLLPPIETAWVRYDEHGRRIWQIRNGEETAYRFDDKEGISQEPVEVRSRDEDGSARSTTRRMGS
jgi:hypothetical protein